MNIQVIMEQMLVLFAMMLIGYFIWKKQWMDDNASVMLSKIVINIFNPLLVIYGVTGKSRGSDFALTIQNLGFMVFYYVLLILISIPLILLLRPKKADKNIYRLMTIFANVGFMGIPVISSVFGQESIIYVAFYMLGYNILLYTYGLFVARQAGIDAGSDKVMVSQGVLNDFKKLINPGVVASLFAVLVFFFGITLPEPVVTFCDYVGNATIPLSMLLIGISIAKADLKSIFTNKKLYLFIFLRMIALPVCMALILRNFNFLDMAVGIFILQLAMPVGTVTVLLAKENGADESFCTDGIVLTTLASIVTIPIAGLML